MQTNTKRKPSIFFAFVRKEFLHVMRDRKSLLILLGLPVMMMLLFGFALSNEVKNSQFIVLDQASDNASRTLTDRIDQSQFFTLAGHIYDEKEIETAFKGIMHVWQSCFHPSSHMI